MATSVEINAVVDNIVAAFGGDVALFRTWLDRSKLEADVAAIDSQMRVVAAQRDAGVTAAETELQALQAARTAKLAEIDAL